MLLGRYFSTKKYMFFFVFVNGQIREREEEEEEARRRDIETEFLSTSKTASQMPLCGTSCHKPRYVTTYRVCLALCAVCLRTVIGISKETAKYRCESCY
jgi:hypothetical protein